MEVVQWVSEWNHNASGLSAKVLPELRWIKQFSDEAKQWVYSYFMAVIEHRNQKDCSYFCSLRLASLCTEPPLLPTKPASDQRLHNTQITRVLAKVITIAKQCESLVFTAREGQVKSYFPKQEAKVTVRRLCLHDSTSPEESWTIGRAVVKQLGESISAIIYTTENKSPRQ